MTYHEVKTPNLQNIFHTRPSFSPPRPRHVAQEFIVMRALIFFTSNWKFYTLNNLYWGSLSHKTPPKGFEIFGDFLSSRLFFRIIAAPQCRLDSFRGLFQGPEVGFRCSSSLVGPSVFSGGGSLRNLIYFKITKCVLGGRSV